MSTGGYLDLGTGEVYDETATDAMLVGEGAAIDVEEEPDRWLWFHRTDSTEGWRDMASFAQRQHDPALRARLERLIEGKGAFRPIPRPDPRGEPRRTVVRLLHRPPTGPGPRTPRRRRHPRGLTSPPWQVAHSGR